jgi:hypothetical protein
MQQTGDQEVRDISGIGRPQQSAALQRIAGSIRWQYNNAAGTHPHPQGFRITTKTVGVISPPALVGTYARSTPIAELASNVGLVSLSLRSIIDLCPKGATILQRAK